ncbi:MAG: hypothetical protein CMI14_11290 [Oleispira sp.]|nr:hypothetical protein [Oleispira sp.]|tara:strand:- start:3579 stop:3800 length:222 start_codon:yes stop_codon:yes gene_type:complete
MSKLLIASALLLTVTACANQSVPTEMLNKDLLDEAQPIYQSCLKEYEKTMSEEDARKACLEKLKSSYEKVSAM